MLPRGTTLTHDVQGATAKWFALPRTEGQVRSNVIAGLRPYYDVHDVVIARDSFLSDPLNYLTGWSYRAQVTLTTRTNYGAVDDVNRVIAHVFYLATGEMPTVTARGIGTQQDVSTIGGVDTVDSGGLLDDLGSGVTTVLGGLTDSLGLIGLGALALGAVVLVVWAGGRD